MAVKYLGTDLTTDWLPGVPARDLSDEELGAMTPAQQAAVKGSKLYRAETRRAKE